MQRLQASVNDGTLACDADGTSRPLLVGPRKKHKY